MKEIKGNLWTYHEQGYYIVVPTNGDINKGRKAVMGRGVARQASQKYSLLNTKLGEKLQKEGNNLYVFPEYGLITFPVKFHWMDTADIPLIRRSCRQLADLLNEPPTSLTPPVYLPRVGCGNGNLEWKEVQAEIRPLLDDNFIICDIRGEKDEY